MRLKGERMGEEVRGRLGDGKRERLRGG